MTEKPTLTILYQDEHIVAIDKPASLFVHRSFLDKNERFFALQLLRDQLGQYVYPVHRLDKPTSGVLLFALSSEVARTLTEAFTEREVSKTYYALVRGFLEKQVTVDYPLKEKLDKIGDKYASEDTEAKDALTCFETLCQGTIDKPLGKYNSVRYSLVKATPKTGRRHQIRRHLAHLRYPIIGDVNYGDNKQNPFFAQEFGFRRLMLFAQSLTFPHPVTKTPVTIAATFDEQWLAVFDHLGWQPPQLEESA
ncbi:tRNA pseudouridine(65) synthase TruC [Thalassotalea euphylliae]|uniref:tRNA pseudouridine(65) synthase TruC n=1 Tax=Thalassotalea euphylliae TaxID=1655234 RepID=UPI00364551B0